MVSQLTAYAEILCLLMTLFSAGASARNDIFLQSACSLKFVQVKDGVVIADGAYGDVRPQIFTLEAVLTEPCFPHCGAAITIYSKEAKRYICLDANGRPKSRRLPPDIDKPRRCLFYEQMDGGAFRFQSVEFPAWYLGFHKNGKPITAGTPGGVGGGNGGAGPRARGRSGGAGAGGGGGKAGGEGAKGTVQAGGKTGGREKRRRQINEKCFNFERSNASSGALDEPRLLQPKVEQQQRQQQQQQQQQPHQHRHKQKLLRHQQLQQQQQQQQSSLRELPDENVPPAGIGGSQGNALTEATATGVPGQPYPPHPHRHKHGSGRKGKGSRKAVTPVAGQAAPHPNLQLAAGTVASSTFYSTGPSVATVSEDPPSSSSSSWKATRRPSHLNLHPLIGDVEAALEAAATKQRPRTPSSQPSGLPPLYGVPGAGHLGGRSANGGNQRRPEHYLHQQSVPPASQSGTYGGTAGSNTSIAGSGGGASGGASGGPRKKASSASSASIHGRNASKVSSKAEKRMLG
ncbi:ecdysone-induced protein 74EF-like isoform X2 [Anopheles albimanus]|uniref:ecdysone-induced protein 74EF-like isoform X2 n=1 Tax=Anopheles albimanus TaxID=7167 RepID=UPI00163FE3BE|nr:ecdysone-induced protein 74EF-like isoform X2 [Anopheles albimanus]XP_035791500.1 ecdysone-induced protein 74EF-like isoform X2 [Anopheles albimanus]XP_035791501.1 ecdysone-induced protein 74EF-like isoform X2 [Anopheles albimanus]XP_035791502.1 ecdysone-induced protein 74EF-like isoform X2 [Anopheles albimanus]XP_035791503.1 ecdysone-induced protein 74EF-like isoform X2 [Anopheles albimanus]XP_035791504.1 ecdysone-induced protein 74EF-like isoform X2 [Anopheles albimanus]XP_035791505.1 ec